MKSEYYYEYCKGLLAVKTNQQNFKWIYGSIAPLQSKEKYDNCIVKFDVCIKPEKQLSEVGCSSRHFQAYMWDQERETLYYRRKFGFNFSIGYNIRIKGNTVFAEVGENYYRFIKNRIQNLHGMYYLLSDIANVLLLKNGYLTLYAAGMCGNNTQNGMLLFGPPNTGKTLTVTQVCKKSGYSLLGEDVVITNGTDLYSCPWTSSFRKKKCSFDEAGAFGRTLNNYNYDICEKAKVNDVVLLLKGEEKEKINCDKSELHREICILNGYLFNYFSSPILKILAFMKKDYSEDWGKISDSILKTIVTNCNCHSIQTKNSAGYQSSILKIIDDGM